MNQKAVRVPEGTFHSALIPIAAVLSALSAIAGVISIALLFTPNAIYFVEANPLRLSARQTWTVIHILFLVFSTLWSAIVAGGLISALAGRLEKGMDLISRCARILRHAIAVVTVAIALVFALRTVRFVKVCMGVDGGIIPLFSTMLAEVVLAGIAVAIIRFLRRVLECADDTALSLSYTVSTLTIRSYSFDPFASTGMLFLGFARLYQFTNRFLAAGTWANQQLPEMYSHMLLFAGVMFLLGGTADFLLHRYLRRLKLKSEYLLYKGTPIEQEN